MPEQVRAGLVACRERGLSFDAAWAETIGTRRQRGTVVFPHFTPERHAWKDVLAETRDEWRAAYDRVPTEVAAAVGRVAGLLAAGDDASADAGRPDSGVVRTVFVLPPSSISRPLAKMRGAA